MRMDKFELFMFVFYTSASLLVAVLLTFFYPLWFLGLPMWACFLVMVYEWWEAVHD